MKNTCRKEIRMLELTPFVTIVQHPLEFQSVIGVDLGFFLLTTPQ